MPQLRILNVLNTKKTVIFFPIEAGLAHITRSLAIAEELLKQKYKVIFALTKKKQFLVKNEKIQVINIGEFFGDDQLVEKIKQSDYLYPFVKEELEILKKYKVDLAVIDFRISAIVSCKILNIPSVFITNSDGLPLKTYLPNFNLPKSFQNLVNPLFNILIFNLKLKYLDTLVKVSKLLDENFNKKDLFDMTYIIPEPKSYLPPLANSFDTNYVGPIWWDGFDDFKPPWLKDIKLDGRTIYLTFGGTGYDPNKLVSLAETLVKKGYRVIVSSSNIVHPSAFKKLDDLFVEKFLPGSAICKKADLVVCHGGIGTLVQALLSKKPIVVIPFNPDQYLHAFRFQELGLARCVQNLTLLDLIKLDWENFEDKARDLPVSKVLDTIEEVLSDKDSFKAAIDKFSKEFSNTDGAKKAASVIESML